jgi:hypothetical protein
MKQIAGTLPEPKMQSVKRKSASQAAATLPPVQEREVKTKKEKAGAKKSRFGLVSFWPLAVAVFLAGFAPEWHSMAVQAGIWVMRFTFPYSLLASHRTMGLDGQMTTIMPQLALYAQLPIDGILMMLLLAFGRTLKSAIVQLLLLHAVCALVLWLITFAAK